MSNFRGAGCARARTWTHSLVKRKQPAVGRQISLQSKPRVDDDNDEGDDFGGEELTYTQQFL